MQFSFNFNSMTYSQWEYGLTLTGDGRHSNMAWLKTDLNCNFAFADPEGGGDHKLYVFFLDIMIRTPRPPGKSWTPPLENVRPPLVPWKGIVFSVIKPLDPSINCKIG